MKLSLPRQSRPHTPPAKYARDDSNPAFGGTDLEHALSAAFDQMLAQRQRQPSSEWHSSPQPSAVSLPPVPLDATLRQSRTTLQGAIAASPRPIALYQPSPSALRDMSARHRQLKHSSKIQHSSSSTRQYIEASGRRAARRRKTRGVKSGFAPSSPFPPMTPSTESFTSEGSKSWVEDAAVTMQYLRTHPTPSSSAGGPSQTTSDTSSIYPASTPPSSPTFSNPTPNSAKVVDETGDTGTDQAVDFTLSPTHESTPISPRSPPLPSTHSVRRHPPNAQQRNARRYRKSKILANNNFYLPPLFSDEALQSSTHLPCHHAGPSGDPRVLDSHETITFKDFKSHRAHPILTLCSSPRAVEPLSEQPPPLHPKVSPLVAATTALKSMFFAKANRNKTKEAIIREQQPVLPAEEVWRANVLTQAVTQLVAQPEQRVPHNRPLLTPRASKQTLRTTNHLSAETLTTNKGSFGRAIAFPRPSSDLSSSSASDDFGDEDESSARSDASNQNEPDGQGASRSIANATPPPPIDVIASLQDFNDDSFDRSSCSSSNNMFERSTVDSQSSATRSENSDTLSSLWRALADPTLPPPGPVSGKTILEELVFRDDNGTVDGNNDRSLSRVIDWRTKVQVQGINGLARDSVVSRDSGISQ